MSLHKKKKSLLQASVQRHETNKRHHQKKKMESNLELNRLDVSLHLNPCMERDLVTLVRTANIRCLSCGQRYTCNAFRPLWRPEILNLANSVADGNQAVLCV